MNNIIPERYGSRKKAFRFVSTDPCVIEDLDPRYGTGPQKDQRWSWTSEVWGFWKCPTACGGEGKIYENHWHIYIYVHIYIYIFYIQIDIET